MGPDVLAGLAATRKKKKRKKRGERKPAVTCRYVKRSKLVHGERKTVRVRKCRPKRKPVTAVRTHPPAMLRGGGSGVPPVATPPAPPRLR